MTCTESRIFIGAFLDGELDLARSIELERHLETCAACAALCESHKSAHESLANPELRFSAPGALRKRVSAAVFAQARASSPSEQPWYQRAWLRWGIPSAVAALAGVAAMMFVLRLPPAPDPLAQEMVDAHVRSLMPNHLMDVISTDQHTVKPWFAGKVDFSPPVKDHGQEGYPLIGGRVDYVGGHAAAVMVYQRNKHVINVFVWPVTTPLTSVRTFAEHGYNIVEMDCEGMNFWIVSDLNLAELRQFADILAN